MASLGGIETEFDDVKPSLFGMSHTISNSIPISRQEPQS